MDLSNYTCPITYQIFHDPVIAEDGHTYERYAIEQWLTTHITSPITREVINTVLITNYNARSNVTKFLEQHPSEIANQYFPKLTLEEILKLDHSILLNSIKNSKLDIEKLYTPENNYRHTNTLLHTLIEKNKFNKDFLIKLLDVAKQKKYDWNITTVSGLTTPMYILIWIKDEDIVLKLLNTIEDYNWNYQNKNGLTTHMVYFKIHYSTKIASRLIDKLYNVNLKIKSNIKETLPMLILKNINSNILFNKVIYKFKDYDWDIKDFNQKTALMYAIYNKKISNYNISTLMILYRSV